MLRKGKIKVNNKKISQDYRLVLGDIIFIFLPETFKEKNEEKFNLFLKHNKSAVFQGSKNM